MRAEKRGEGLPVFEKNGGCAKTYPEAWPSCRKQATEGETLTEGAAQHPEGVHVQSGVLEMKKVLKRAGIKWKEGGSEQRQRWKE